MQRLLLAASLLIAGCYRGSDQWKHAWSTSLEAHEFPMSVDQGLESLRRRAVVEEVSPPEAKIKVEVGARLFRVTILRLPGDNSEERSFLILARERDHATRSSYAALTGTDEGWSEFLWAGLEAESYERERAAIDARGQSGYEQSQVTSEAAETQAVLKEIAADMQWLPRWGFTGAIGVNVQTNVEGGVGLRAGLRRWFEPHLGWSVDLGYDFEVWGPLPHVRHQLALEPHLDILWKPLRPGSASPAASLSLFAAPLLSISAVDVGFGWRAGVRASKFLENQLGLTGALEWIPFFVSVSYEETRVARLSPSVTRSVRLSIGFGF